MFVAIIKRVSDLEDKSRFSGLPRSYPVDCAEGETREELAAAYPNATILSAEEYRGYARGMGELYVHSFKPPGFFKRLLRSI